MTNPFEDSEIDCRVLVNAQGQYSLWPAFREVPVGWSAVGPNRRRQDCLDWIDAHWTDIRPKSSLDLPDGTNQGDAN